jgi:hypothetical protein
MGGGGGLWELMKRGEGLGEGGCSVVIKPKPTVSTVALMCHAVVGTYMKRSCTNFSYVVTVTGIAHKAPNSYKSIIPPRRAGFDSMSCHVGFVDKSSPEGGFSPRRLQFSCEFSLHQVLRMRSHSQCSHNTDVIK